MAVTFTMSGYKPHIKHNRFNVCCVQEAVKNCEYWRLIDEEGKPPGLLGWWPSKACTFIDNHDTGASRRLTSRSVIVG